MYIPNYIDLFAVRSAEAKPRDTLGDPSSIPFRFSLGIPARKRHRQCTAAPCWSGDATRREGTAAGFAFLVYFRSRWFVDVCCVYKNCHCAMVIQHFETWEW